MEKSKVYFTNLRTKMNEGLPVKLQKLIRAAGIENIDFKNKYTAIKIHFGEPGNIAYLRPNYAKAVADVVKSLGGKVFLTDCNTLYVGGRKNALDHIDSAYENGYSPFSTGSNVFSLDGEFEQKLALCFVLLLLAVSLSIIFIMFFKRCV